MKKLLLLTLLVVLCVSVVACVENLDAVEDGIPGEWWRIEETQSSIQVTLSFRNGTVTRSEISKGETKTLTGVYTIDSKGNVVVSYTDGSAQTFTMLVSAEGGSLLSDNASSVLYKKKN